jgi:hypothetical protein
LHQNCIIICPNFFVPKKQSHSLRQEAAAGFILISAVSTSCVAVVATPTAAGSSDQVFILKSYKY